MPKALGRRAREMVLSLIHYFETERDHQAALLPFNAVRERVAAALSISLSTVNKLAAKWNRGEPIRSPKKKRQRTKSVVDINNYDQTAIRNVLYDMYKNKEHVTLKTLHQKIFEDGLYTGGMTSLWKILRNIGFRYKKDDPRRGLMELPNIVFKRLAFLREYIKLKTEGLHQFVFLDETWIFQNGTVGHSWQDSNVKSVKKTKVGGARYIILHAGCAKGFIPGAELVFSSKRRDGDYHGEMDKENFLRWFEYQLLPNLEEPSVIIMDNAPYHSTVINKTPTSASKKAEIAEWLQNNGITYETTMLKPQLLQLVQQNKPHPIYEADSLAEQYGHKVLRPPPYHCIFNAIEHIWGITKRYYSDHINKDGSSVEKSLAMWKESLAQITPEIWGNTINNTEAEIKRWWDREVVFDREDINPIIINLGEDDDDEDDDFLSDDSDSD